MSDTQIYAVKDFALFAGEDYYPNGGWGDFKGVFETEDLAKEHYSLILSRESILVDSWAEIVNLQIMASIWFKHRNGKWRRKTEIPVTDKLNTLR
jgi:hypothetical protein